MPVLPAPPYRPRLPAPGRPGVWAHLAMVLLAVAGSTLAAVGAVFGEMRSGGDPLLGAVVAAPLIEEALKPTGVYVVLAWRSHWLLGRWHSALLSALAGLSFGALENLLYLKVYAPEVASQIAPLRWGLAMPVHGLASAVVGLGITAELARAVRGEVPLFRGAWWRFFLAGVLIHALYNLAVVILEGILGRLP